ncbi:MAG: pyridoxal phosphate-dependent aminotransferase [Patescibacteria group bacterium]|nr:pyridoxal phosphate-dependent aminotransferase [Patescibacteria group bacterium]
MINTKIHKRSHFLFRKYLDIIYGSKIDDKHIFGFSTGYPQSSVFPLPMTILTKMTSIINGKEKPREGYGWEAGSAFLRDSIILHENLLHDTDYTRKNICMVAGASYAFNRIIEYIYENLADGRDELLIIGPTFYRMTARVDRLAKVQSVIGYEKNNFQVTFNQIKKSVTKKTRAVFLVNPSNPTYIYYSDEFMNSLISFLNKENIYLIIDESGDAFYFNKGNLEKKFTKLIQNQNVVRIVTASKKYLLAEYRIGCVIAHKDFMGDKITGFIGLIGDDIGNAPLAANDAWNEIIKHEILKLKGIKCTDPNCDFVYIMEKNYLSLKSKRNMVIEKLKSVSCVKNIIIPDSNFNLCFGISSKEFKNDIKFFEDLLSSTGVSLLPCSTLGIPGNLLYFRFTYALSNKELKNGLNFLVKYLENIK